MRAGRTASAYGPERHRHNTVVLASAAEPVVPPQHNVEPHPLDYALDALCLVGVFHPVVPVGRRLANEPAVIDVPAKISAAILLRDRSAVDQLELVSVLSNADVLVLVGVEILVQHVARVRGEAEVLLQVKLEGHWGNPASAFTNHSAIRSRNASGSSHGSSSWSREVCKHNCPRLS